MNSKLSAFLSGAGVCLSLALLSGCEHAKVDAGTLGTVSPKAEPPSVEVVSPTIKRLRRQSVLRGEMLAYQDVAIFPKVTGFIDSIGVDRGSQVKNGQVLIKISAPELQAQVDEASAKLAKAKSSAMQALSRLASARANVKEAEAAEAGDVCTYQRLKRANELPGAISMVELEVAEKKVDAAKEHVSSLKSAVAAAESDVAAAQSEIVAATNSLRSIKQMNDYLTVRAPFDGVVTSRNVHAGSLVSSSDRSQCMLRCEEINRLRLVVPVPEIAVSGIKNGLKVPFAVAAYPDKKFIGTVARIGHALDQKTRTMPVELDVDNSSGQLEPGMYPEVFWSVERPYETKFLPDTSVGHSLSATYVDVVRDGIIHVVPVTVGQNMDGCTEVFASLKPTDQVVARASEDLKDGMEVAVGKRKEGKVR